MALTYNVNTDSHRVLVSGSGSAGFNQLVELMNNIVRDRGVAPDFDVVADFSSVAYAPSLMEIRKLGQVFETYRQAFKGKVAFVVKDGLQLRLGRFASLVAGMIQFELSVFKDTLQADAWLRHGKEETMEELKSRVFGILGKFQLAALATVTPEGLPWVRYVTTKATDDLNIRFATPADSRKVAHIKANPEVHLTCGGGSLSSAEDWVQVEGRAEVCEDPDEKARFWNDNLTAYFDGPEDSKYMVITIVPKRIEYMTMESLVPEILKL